MLNQRKPLSFDLTDEDAVVGSIEYIGDLPPARMALAGIISRIYADITNNGKPVFKVLYRASIESGYDGYTAWDNVTLSKDASFKWVPLIEALGVTVAELAKGTVTDENDTSGAGTRVIRIGSLDLSGDNSVPVYFGVKYRKFDGIQQTDVIGVRARAVISTDKPERDDLSPFVEE